jgi:hypothetical protein
MKWIKKGRIFVASGEFGWMRSHTQVPTALVLHDRIRVYFSTRPEDGMSRVAFIDLDLDNPSRVLYLHDKPVLELGGPGMFDEHGTIPNHVFSHDDGVYLFYVGWSRGESVPYSNWMGMAVSHDSGATFTKAFKGPILDRTRDEVYSATGLICIEHDASWYGWYATGTNWISIEGRLEHTYELRSCRSENLVDWRRPNQPLFPAVLPNESSTRPTVVSLNGKWHMWFCYRGTLDFRDGGDSYRIGHACSTDLTNWTRSNRAGIEPSSAGWDSTMLAYPCVVKVDERVLMFYSGNHFGRSGFGYAELEELSDGL